MTAPAKPWEGAGLNLRSSTSFGLPGPLHSSSALGQAPAPLPSVRRVSRTVPPPIPARIGGGAYRQNYGRPAYTGTGGWGSAAGAYGSGYASTYGGGYGAYGGGAAYGGGYGGGYGSQMYGSGAYGMSRYPHQHGMSSLESRFIQMAEENSRPAFESIESLVQAFGSVSFMMESTFHAMYSSFRAVLGVAENFGRLRSLFGQVFQTFAVLRMFQWIYRKLLYYLGIRHDNPGREAVWKEAGGQLDPKTRRTFWPVAMFLSLVCGGPFLVWRLLKSINVAPPPPTDNSFASPRTWVNGSVAVTLPVAVVLHDFTAARDNELSVRHGQPLFVAPSHLQTPDSDWVLVTINWKECGLVPANFIQVVEHRKYLKPKSKQGAVTAKPPEQPASPGLSPEMAARVSTNQLPVVPDSMAAKVQDQWVPNVEPRSTPDVGSWRPEASTALQPSPSQATGRLGDMSQQATLQPSPSQATGRLGDISQQATLQPSPSHVTGRLGDMSQQAALQPSPSQATGRLGDISQQATLQPSPSHVTGRLGDISQQATLQPSPSHVTGRLGDISQQATLQPSPSHVTGRLGDISQQATLQPSPSHVTGRLGDISQQATLQPSPSQATDRLADLSQQVPPKSGTPFEASS